MGNLGGYQTLTTVVKALGGPTKAVAVIGGGLLLAGGALYAGGQQAVKAVVSRVRKRAKPCPQRGQVFAVSSDFELTGGLIVRAGDEIRVIECAGDAVIVEVIGRDDNPHVVSGEFLSRVSQYPLRSDEIN